VDKNSSGSCQEGTISALIKEKSNILLWMDNHTAVSYINLHIFPVTVISVITPLTEYLLLYLLMTLEQQTDATENYLNLPTPTTL